MLIIIIDSSWIRWRVVLSVVSFISVVGVGACGSSSQTSTTTASGSGDSSGHGSGGTSAHGGNGGGATGGDGSGNDGGLGNGGASGSGGIGTGGNGAGNLGGSGGQGGQPSCGDGVVEADEECDGSNLGGHDCTDIGKPFVGGVLACDGDCVFDTSNCTLSPACGNEIAEDTELCDGLDLNGQSCVTVGAYSGGTLSCNALCTFDTSLCNGAPTVPTLQSPIPGTYVGSIRTPGSLRPIFRWLGSTVPGGANITYDVQLSTDPTLSNGATTTTAALHHQPMADLPVSMVAPVGARYHWRVRACAGSACSDYTAPWYFDVGRSDRDFNGDGFADIAAGAPSQSPGGAVHIYFGQQFDVMDTVADGVLVGGGANESFGAAIATAGDLNGDGFADLVVGAPLSDIGAADGGAAYVYFGGAGATFDATPDGTLHGTNPGEAFGASVTGIGDTNGDGFADIAIGLPKRLVGGSPSGAIRMYLGNSGSTLDAIHDWECTGSLGEELGRSISGIGDVDGDTFTDILVGAPLNDAAGTNTGSAYIFRGGVSASCIPLTTLVGAAPGDDFGRSVSTAGDVNADGYRDIVIGARYHDKPMGTNAGAAYVFFGGQTGMHTTADGTFLGVAAFDQFGAIVATAGDVNRDGFDDIIVGAPLNDTNGSASGAAYLYFGGASEMFDGTIRGILIGAKPGDVLGTSVATAGDVNGDGFADVVVGAPWSDTNGTSAGSVRLFLGGTGTSFESTVDKLFWGSAAGDELGRAVQ